MRALFLPVALAVLSSHSVADAQERPPESDLVSITGTVVDAVTRQPIESVFARLSGTGFIAETDTSGRFTLSNIRVGSYQLSLSHPDYHPSVGDFNIMRSGEFETSLRPVYQGIRDEVVTGIIGVVSDNRGDNPIDQVSVYIETGRRGASTDTRGRFVIDDLTPGLKTVRFSALGYVTRTELIEVQPDRVTNVRLSLSADPVDLDPIEVSVERREIALQGIGFYHREAEGFGEFIDREEIEFRAPVQMSDLFRRIVGAEVRSGADGPFQRFVMLRGGRSDGCFPRVLLDGIVVHPGGDEAAAIDDLIDPAAVSGVEVYPSSTGVPMQYSGTDASCGVILIWTRR